MAAIASSSNAATLNAGVGQAILVSSGTNRPFSASVVTGCATTASPATGTWSVDYSQQTAPAISYTDMVIGSTTTQFTSSNNPVAPNIVGNMIAVTSGTGFTVQRVQIVSVSGTTATCDKTLGTAASTGGHGGLGGAMATNDYLASNILWTSSNAVFIKNSGGSSSPTIYSTTGPYLYTGGSLYFPLTIIGYATNRFYTNTDAQPIINAGSSNIIIFLTSNSYFHIVNLNITNSSAYSSVRSIQFNSASNRVVNCTISGSTYSSILDNSVKNMVINCVIKPGALTNHAVALMSQSSALGCTVIGGSSTTGSAFYTAPGTLINCVVDGFSPLAAQQAAFLLYDNNSNVIDCIAYNISGSGIGFSNSSVGNGPGIVINSISHSCKYGFYNNSTDDYNSFIILNCAGYNNTTANYNGTFSPENIQGFVALSSDPFTNETGTPPNFTLNSSGGASIQGVGWPTTLPGLTGTSYNDIGAYQHQSGTGTSYYGG